MKYIGKSFFYFGHIVNIEQQISQGQAVEGIAQNTQKSRVLINCYHSWSNMIPNV